MLKHTCLELLLAHNCTVTCFYSYYMFLVMLKPLFVFIGLHSCTYGKHFDLVVTDKNNRRQNNN